MSHEIVPVTREQFMARAPFTGEDAFGKAFHSKADMQHLWDDCRGIFVGGMLAAAIITTVSKREPRVANLQLVHTFSAYRNRGLGRLLCEAAFQGARDRGARYFRVSAEPEAVAFYERLGYKFLGRQKSGCQLSICRIEGPTVQDGVVDSSDPVIRAAIDSRRKGGVVEEFRIRDDQHTVDLKINPERLEDLRQALADSSKDRELEKAARLQPPKTYEAGGFSLLAHESHNSVLAEFARVLLTERMVQATEDLLPKDWDKGSRILYLGDLLKALCSPGERFSAALAPAAPRPEPAPETPPPAAAAAEGKVRKPREKKPRPAPVPFLNPERMARLENFRKGWIQRSSMQDKGPRVVNIRGTSGSGKTHLVRSFLDAHRIPGDGKLGIEPVREEGHRHPVGYLVKRYGKRDVFVAGQYETECGGCDGFSGQGALDFIYDLVERQVTQYDRHVLFEGLIVCSDFRRTADLVSQEFPIEILLLSTPLEQCRANIDARRAGNGKPPLEHHRNTDAKHEGNLRSVPRFEGAGVPIRQVSVDEARAHLEEVFA